MATHYDHYRKSGNYIGIKGIMGSRGIRESKGVRESEGIRDSKGVGVPSVRGQSVRASVNIRS